MSFVFWLLILFFIRCWWAWVPVVLVFGSCAMVGRCRWWLLPIPVLICIELLFWLHCVSAHCR